MKSFLNRFESVVYLKCEAVQYCPASSSAITDQISGKLNINSFNLLVINLNSADQRTEMSLSCRVNGWNCFL